MTIDEITSQATDEIHLVTLYRQKHNTEYREGCGIEQSHVHTMA